jgi:hypothetical protein
MHSADAGELGLMQAYMPKIIKLLDRNRMCD